MSDPANFEEWSRLLHWFSRRVWGRSVRAGAEVPYEDIFAESCVAWCVARDNFDPDRGVKFSVYLVNGARLHLNRWLQRQIVRKLKESSLEIETDGDSYSWLDAIADENVVDPELGLERRRRLDIFVRRLSPRARQYLTLLANPPEEIQAISRAIDARNARARACGYARFTLKDAYSRIIFDLMGAGVAERKRIAEQIEARLNKGRKESGYVRQ